VIVGRRGREGIDEGDVHRGDDISGPLVQGAAAVTVKHAADRILAAAALIVLSPVIAGISAWVRRDAGRPVIFRQRRTGKDGRVFELHKFRTLADGPNLSDDPFGHLPDDPRITRSGRFLRATSLDELPQLYDVLRGDMSLVGPRADIVSRWRTTSRTSAAALPCAPGSPGGRR